MARTLHIFDDIVDDSWSNAICQLFVNMGEVATICAVCFFVLRSLFASGDVPFWASDPGRDVAGP